MDRDFESRPERHQRGIDREEAINDAVARCDLSRADLLRAIQWLAEEIKAVEVARACVDSITRFIEDNVRVESNDDSDRNRAIEIATDEVEDGAPVDLDWALETIRRLHPRVVDEIRNQPLARKAHCRKLPDAETLTFESAIFEIFGDLYK